MERVGVLGAVEGDGAGGAVGGLGGLVEEPVEGDVLCLRVV